MAGSKATKHPTKTDTLIRTVDQARQARGLNRHRIIPRVSQLPTGGGGQAAIGGFGASGNFLDPTGDTMIGPIAFSPKQTFIDDSDPDNPSMDIGINSGDYSTYIQVTGDNEELRTIFGASFNGQLLYLQYTGIGQLTIKQGDGTDGGNIVTNTGGDLLVNFGGVVIMLFDPTGGADPAVNGAWRVVAGGTSGGGGVTQLADLSDVDFPTALINDQVLTFNGTSMLWENKAFPSGGMATDLSNMIFPTVPTVDLSMNNQNIVALNAIDFDGVVAAIQGIRTINFFQSNNSIFDTSVNGLSYLVNDSQRHLFTAASGDIAAFTRNGTDSALDMLSTSAIENIPDLNFSLTGEDQILNRFSLAYDSAKGNLGAGIINVPINQDIFFEQAGNARIRFGDFAGIGMDIQDPKAIVFSDATIEPTRTGEISRSGGDIFAFTSNGVKNLKDIGAGGAGNEISQGNSSVTVIDTGSGSITEIVDGSVIATKNVSTYTINQPVSFQGNTLSAMGDVLPASGKLFGGPSNFWASSFLDRISLQNTNNTLIGSSLGISHNVGGGGIHEFEISSVPQLTIRQNEIDVEGNNLVAINDIVMNGTASVLDMNRGDISDVDDITAATAASLLDWNGGDIINVDNFIMDGAGSVLNMNGGNIINVNDLSVLDDLSVGGTTFMIGSLTLSGTAILNGTLDHNGTQLGFFGGGLSTKKTTTLANFTTAGNANAINILLGVLEDYGLIDIS